jgi:serine protease AprX
MQLSGYRLLFGLIVTLATNLAAQVAPDMYWVQFTNKSGTPYSIENPQEFLSERAITRRIKQGIKITTDDLPVTPAYVDSLKSLGLTIHNTSKWLNGAVIISTDTALIDTLDRISFIASPVRFKQTKAINRKIVKECPFPKDAEDYGLSKAQLEMLHASHLHSAGYKGNGMLVAILDAGFNNSKTIESLQHLWNNNKIFASRDFVKDSQDMFHAHNHGTLVLSIMAGIIETQMYSSAPEASYVLVRTENGSSENIVEEYNWVSGAEYADSLGVDVINSSLGYYNFDDPRQDHSYSDMDGKTTPVSRGTSLAARKGILVSNSAGNEGDNSWYHITAPADADSILAVGAVDTLGIIAGFSSRGPSADARIKPDICAVGKGTVGQYQPDKILLCNGTSCSSPIIAGLAACLWQSEPNASAMQIRKAIIESSNRFENPDSLYGYGIPDFIVAGIILDSSLNDKSDLSEIKLFPNPIHEYAYMVAHFPWLTSEKTGTIEILDINGRSIFSEERVFSPQKEIIPVQYVSNLEKGFYMLHLIVDNRNFDAPFIKF